MRSLVLMIAAMIVFSCNSTFAQQARSTLRNAP
ncbi:MAG: hypothetical protein QOJ04_3110, partial [Caballeronia sp.]|nr:hypothetical protein [Caballeronia sp.]